MTLPVSSSLLQGSEDTSGLNNIFNTSITAFDDDRVLLLEGGGGFYIDNKLLVLSLDCAKLVMDGIILEHEDHVVKVNEVVTDDNKIHSAELTAALVSRCPIWTNLITPTFTIISQVTACLALHCTVQQDAAAC